MGQLVIAPASRTEPFLELSRTKKGRIFKKHILSTGPLFANGRKIDIDDVYLSQMVDNFHAGHCDIVQVPIVGPDNKHSEDPRDNIGEVVDVKLENGKLYAFIDSRKSEASDELGNTLIGASAMFSPNYLNTTTNQTVGPTLLHVAITNRPHVLNLDDFEEVIAASAGSGDEVILLTEQSAGSSVDNNELEETHEMTLEEQLELLKSEHGIDVTALQAEAGRVEGLETSITELTAERDTLVEDKATAEELSVKLSASIKEHLKSEGLIKLSADASGVDQVETLIGAVAEAGTKIADQGSEIVSLSGRIDSLENDKKETASAALVDELVSAGRILPVQKEAMVALHLSNSELFDKIVPETPLIELSREDGTNGDSTPKADAAEFVQSEVARLSALK